MEAALKLAFRLKANGLGVSLKVPGGMYADLPVLFRVGKEEWNSFEVCKKVALMFQSQGHYVALVFENEEDELFYGDSEIPHFVMEWVEKNSNLSLSMPLSLKACFPVGFKGYDFNDVLRMKTDISQLKWNSQKTNKKAA